MNVASTHAADWNDRLQDLVDGMLPRELRAVVQAHVTACDACRQQLELLHRLDESLGQALPAPRLGVEFDAGILQSIADEPSVTPITIRKSRFEREHQFRVDNLKRGLRRQWRSSIPDLIAGAAVLAAMPPILERTVTVLSSLSAGLPLPVAAGPGLVVAIAAILGAVAVAAHWQQLPG